MASPVVVARIKPPNAPAIMAVVAIQFGMTVPEIKEKTNRHKVVYPRQIAMYLIKQLTSDSFSEIGRRFGRMHHTTVMYAVEKIGRLRESDTDLNDQLFTLSNYIQAMITVGDRHES